MTALRFRRRTAAWLALAGMALNAFWPLLADARPSVPALPSEICSAAGLKHSGDGAPPGGGRAIYTRPGRRTAGARIGISGEEKMKEQFAIVCGLALLPAAGAAQASCGTAFCVLNTNWATQGVAAEPGTARLDMRFE